MTDLFDTLGVQAPPVAAAPSHDLFDTLGIKAPGPEVQKPAVPQGFIRLLHQSGLPPQDQQRLMRTGITPGNAIEWGAAAIQQVEATRGGPLAPHEQLAIEDTFKRLAGRHDLSNKNFFQIAHERQLAARGQTMLGKAQDIASGFASDFAGTGFALLKTVAPETANHLQAATQNQYQTAPGSRAWVGSTLGELAKLPVYIETGPVGMAALFGAQGLGSARGRVAELRRSGQHVSGLAEWGTALGVAGTQALTGYLGGRIFEGMGKALESLSSADNAALEAGTKQGLQRAVKTIATHVGGGLSQGTQMAVMQLATNAIMQGVDPKQALTRGVAQAFTLGALMSPFGAAIAHYKLAGQAGQVAAQADGAPAAEPREPITRVDRLLPAPTSETQTINDRAATARKQFEALPSGEQRPLQVDSQGRVMTPDQVDALDKAGADLGKKIAAPPQKALPLPADVPRFGANAKGEIVDFRNPNPERRVHPTADRQRVQDLLNAGKIDEAQTEIGRLRKALYTDPVTGEGTKALQDVTGKEIQIRAKRRKAAQPIAYLDVRNLHTSNEVLGHAGMDAKMKDWAAVLRKHLGPDAMIARHGGDEFSVMWPKGSSQRAAKAGIVAAVKEIGTPEVANGVSTGMDAGVDRVRPGEPYTQGLGRAEAVANAQKVAAKMTRGEATTREGAVATATAEGVRPPSPDLTVPAGTEAARRAGIRGTERVRRANMFRFAERARRVELTANQTHEGEQLDAGRKQIQDHLESPKGLLARFAIAANEGWLAGYDHIMTPLISLMEDKAPKIAGRLFEMEKDAHVHAEQLKVRLTQSGKTIRKALGGRRSKIYKKWAIDANNYANDLEGLLRVTPPAAHEAVQEFLRTFHQLRAVGVEAGMTIGDLGPGFWPRYIKDLKGLHALLGKDTGVYEDAWITAAKLTGKPLTPAEQVAVVNSVTQGYGPRKAGDAGVSNVRTRTQELVTPESQPHYVDPIESGLRYVDTMTYAAERTRFLGRHATEDNLLDTVGSLVKEAIDNGEMKPEDQQEVLNLLHIRFTGDLLQMSKPIRAMKQLIYFAHLSNILSAISQLNDVVWVAQDYGVVNTLHGIRQAIKFTANDRRQAMEEIGVHDHGEELKDVGKFAKATDASLKYSGFKRFDRFGKEVRLNASRRFLERMAMDPTTKEAQTFWSRYRRMFEGERVDQVQQDLRSGQMTENVRLLQFMELARAQPLTLSQMPPQYLQMRNGKILYAMKTFMAVQLDKFRREIMRDMLTKGTRTRGAKKLGRFILINTLIGTPIQLVISMLEGHKLNADEIGKDMVSGLLNGVALNRYVFTSIGATPVKGVWDYFAPAVPVADSLPQDIYEGVTQHSANYSWLPAVGGARVTREIPGVGWFFYYWSPLGKGYYYNQIRAKKEYTQALKNVRTSAASAYQSGDIETARRLTQLYNRQRTKGIGDQRKHPLTFGDLRRASVVPRGRG